MSQYNGKGLLVIGGGLLQVPAIEKCRELGIRTYLIDGDENCLARNSADDFFCIDIRDIDACIKIGADLKNGNKINGVFTQGTDVEHVVAKIAEELKFPGLSYPAAINCNDKALCRSILTSKGIDPTKFWAFNGMEQMMASLPEIVYPCFVKPVNNSASRGIRRVQNSDQLIEAFTFAFTNCYGEKKVIIEEEIIGEEYSVDSFVIDGKLYPCGVSDRIFLQKNNFAVQVGSRTPSILPADVHAQIYSLMEESALALGVNNSAFKGDLVVDGKGTVRIIEFAGRTSGGFDSQYRKPLSFGIDIMKVVIDLALGHTIDYRDLIPKWVKWSSTYSVITEPGIIEDINNFDEVAKLPGVKRSFLLKKKGERVEEMIDCAKRFNYFISVADTLGELMEIENMIKKNLNIVICK